MKNRFFSIISIIALFVALSCIFKFIMHGGSGVIYLLYVLVALFNGYYMLGYLKEYINDGGKRR